MIIESTVSINDLKPYLIEKQNEGFGPICMYAVENGDIQRSIRTVLRKNDCVEHIVTPLDSNTYPCISDDLPVYRHYEREMQEMNGLVVDGLKDYGPNRLMWAYEGGYPLQKGELPEKRYNVPIKANEVKGEGVFEIPVGPVHAGVIEPGHFRFSVAGEPILKVHTHMGYTHRNIERMLESPVSKNNVRIIERIVGDSAVASALAYCNALEGDQEIPYRANLLRVIYAELERIACYIGDIGGMAQDTGFTVSAATGAGIREKMLRLNRGVSGHRYLMGTIVPGGVRTDISDDSLAAIQDRMMKVSFDIEGLMEMMDKASLFTDRTETTGILTEDVALRYRAVGPVARAAGIKTDIRKDLPYGIYKDLGFRLITEKDGDVAARLHVKYREIVESVSLINQCLDKMEPGELSTKITTEDGFHMGLVEAPRGELMHAMEVVNGKIWRYKIRDPSFVNWIVLERVLPGNIIPDFPLINKSFNLSYSGNDL